MHKLIGLPKHKDLIFDVGMHKGEDTEFYLRKGFRVLGFEANPELVDFCRNRLGDYIAAKKLTIVEGAIVDPDATEGKRKEVLFYRNNKNSVWGTVDLNWAERNVRSGGAFSPIQVGVVDFAEVLREHGMPHFMKVDIEGCDLVCLNALKRFRERPDYVSVESDKTGLANIRREIEMLVDLGYDRFQAVDQSAIHFTQSPPNPPLEGDYVDQHFEEGASGLFGSELPDKWKSKNAILRRYRAIMLGYYLLGDGGVMNQWRFRGAWRLQAATRELSKLFKKGQFPGWYDTHARHFLVNAPKD